MLANASGNCPPYSNTDKIMKITIFVHKKDSIFQCYNPGKIVRLYGVNCQPLLMFESKDQRFFIGKFSKTNYRRLGKMLKVAQ